MTIRMDLLLRASAALCPEGTARPQINTPAPTTPAPRASQERAVPGPRAVSVSAPESEGSEPRLEGILDPEKFTVITLGPAHILKQVWGTRTPALEEFADHFEGVWWPCGLWTSRRQPRRGETLPVGHRRIVSRKYEDIVREVATYDVQPFGDDRLWVLGLDKHGEPISVRNLPIDEANSLIEEWDAPRWTDPAAEPDPEPELEDILDPEKFTVIRLGPAHVLAQVWGTRTPAIEEFADRVEGVWWPCGLWTSRRQPRSTETLPVGHRRVIARTHAEVREQVEAYDVQPFGDDRLWVLGLDKFGEPVSVRNLPLDAAERLISKWDAPRWTGEVETA